MTNPLKVTISSANFDFLGAKTRFSSVDATLIESIHNWNGPPNLKPNF